MKEIEECRVAGASKYFWYRTTLNISQGIEHGSQINWTLALTLLITWIIVWLFMIRGIRTEGKVSSGNFLSFKILIHESLAHIYF